ncbi:MAG: hypothetical protein ACK5UE_02475, partial [Chitinophagales bacterium]
MKVNLLIYILFFTHVMAWSQDLPSEDSTYTNIRNTAQNFSIKGYVKDMQSLNFTKDFENLNATNLIHNRINLKWKTIVNLTIYMELIYILILCDDLRNLV